MPKQNTEIFFCLEGPLLPNVFSWLESFEESDLWIIDIVFMFLQYPPCIPCWTCWESWNSSCDSSSFYVVNDEWCCFCVGKWSLHHSTCHSKQNSNMARASSNQDNWRNFPRAKSTSCDAYTPFGLFNTREWEKLTSNKQCSHLLYVHGLLTRLSHVLPLEKVPILNFEFWIVLRSFNNTIASFSSWSTSRWFYSNWKIK